MLINRQWTCNREMHRYYYFFLPTANHQANTFTLMLVCSCFIILYAYTFEHHHNEQGTAPTLCLPVPVLSKQPFDTCKKHLAMQYSAECTALSHFSDTNAFVETDSAKGIQDPGHHYPGSFGMGATYLLMQGLALWYIRVLRFY